MVSANNSSVQEQSRGLGEINTAVTQMDQVTQQNAAMVEESTAASHSLKTEADSLLASVSRFRTNAVEAIAPARVPKPQSSARSGGGQDISSQRKRVAQYAATQGSAALDMDHAADDGWDDF